MPAIPFPATALGSNHGYRFEGDSVHLNAEVTLAAADLQEGMTWSLQLWASGAGFAGRTLAGVRVAEFPLQPLAGCFSVDACVAALPPAGNDAFAMALMLVAGGANHSVEVHDMAIYPTLQYFVQPMLVGALDCRIADGLAEIAIERIANPRAADNLSGTLALEVWALDSPYAGGAWVGTPVASLVLGTLAGGATWSDCHYSVPAVTANAGAALTVMLREWTPAGYLTRDYRNLPATVAEAPVAAVAPAKKVEKKVAKKSAPNAAAKPTSKTVAKPAAKAAAATAPVSVNKASVGELAAVKGLSQAVAGAIVAARPYAKLDELVRAKGMGPKLLEKVGKLLKI